MTRRVLQVLPSLSGGGVEHALIDLVQGLVQETGQALVASAGGMLLEKLQGRGGMHFTIPSLANRHPLAIWRTQQHLKKIVQENDIQLIHVHSRAPAWAVYGVAKKLSIPWITTYHAPYKAQNPLKKFYNSIMARGDHVIAISQFIQNHILSEYGKKQWFDPQKLSCIYQSVDLKRFDPNAVSPEDIQAFRAQHGVSEKNAPCVTSWSFHPFEGPSSFS